MRRFGFIAAVCATTLVPAAGMAADTHGAIVYSPSIDQLFAINNASSERSAVRSVMNACSKLANDCEETTWFVNACGAIALDGQGGWGASWGASEQEASRKAMGECLAAGNSNCQVRTSLCTTGN